MYPRTQFKHDTENTFWRNLRLFGLLIICTLNLPSLAADIPAAPDKAEDKLQLTGQIDTEDEFSHALTLLRGKSFKDKLKAIDTLAASRNPKALHYLKALLEAKLYYRKDDQKIIIARRADKGYALIDPESGENLGTVPKREIKKITLNNAMRRALREKIASLSLSNPDPNVRYAAVDEMLSSRSKGLAATLKTLIDQETNSKVRKLMQVGIALGELDGDKPAKLSALEYLAGNLHPSVRNRIQSMTEDPSEDQAVVTAARAALKKIEDKVYFFNTLETLFFGLSLGSVLVLAAIGLAITFGVMGVINMAHGELIMLGAYTTYLIQQAFPGFNDVSILLAIPAAFIVSGLVGILIERSIIRFLYGRPLETLLATFGVSLILQQLVRSLISPQNVPVSNPSWLSGSLQINSVFSLTYNRLYIILFSLLVFAALYLILKNTRLGLQVRAVAQNRAMARAMGVRSGRVDALTFGLGSGIAGVAGVALSQLTNVGPNLGQSYIIDSFMVVVFGGVGNLFGTLVAGLSLGVANKILEPWAGAVLAKIFVLIFIILFIQKYPRGLFPQKGRAAEN